MGFRSQNYAQLLEQLSLLGCTVRESIADELAPQSRGGANAFSFSAFVPKFLNMDVIVDGDLALHVIKVDAGGAVGGVRSLAQIRAGDQTFMAARPFAEYAYSIAEQSRSIRSPVATGRGRLELDTASCWRSLAGLYRARGDLQRAAICDREANERNALIRG